MTATKAPPKIEIIISYAGLTRSFEVTAHQTVHSLLEVALNAFGIHANRHIQSLFTVEGVELNDKESIEGAGLTSGSRLLLRPSQVKGGSQ